MVGSGWNVLGGAHSFSVASAGLGLDTPLSQPFIIVALCQGAAMFSFFFLMADEDEAEANTVAEVRGEVPFGAKVKRKRAIK